MTDDHEWSADEAEIVRQLHTERPRAGRRVRRRVRLVIDRALHERRLRQRSVVLVGSGSAILALAAVLAVTAPQ